MILKKEPLTFAEVQHIVKDIEEKQELKNYLKRFTQLSKEKALQLKEEIKKLNNLKIREENIVKIVDFLPRNAEELNKIFTEVNLAGAEINEILEIVKKY